MSWQSLPPDLRAIIERVCTPAEIEVLKLKATIGPGGREYGRRRIAQILHVSDTTVRDRLRNAERKIQSEIAAMRGIS